MKPEFKELISKLLKASKYGNDGEIYIFVQTRKRISDKEVVLKRLKYVGSECETTSEGNNRNNQALCKCELILTRVGYRVGRI
jgi:hypothetical protein